MKTAIAHWELSPNLGDALVPWIAARLGVQLHWAPASEARLVLGGSVLNRAAPGTVAWGVGLARVNDPVSQGVQIKVVRGPLSRAIALAHGVECPTIYGDAALILPRLLPAVPAPTPRYRLGLIPHYVDHVRAWTWYAHLAEEWGAVLINVFDPPEVVVEQLCQCERVVSTSLHGLVLCDAYRVPCRWAEFSYSVLGDGTKFRDHLAAVGVEAYEPIDNREGYMTLDDLYERAEGEVMSTYDDSALWACCPLRDM